MRPQEDDPVHAPPPVAVVSPRAGSPSEPAITAHDTPAPAISLEAEPANEMIEPLRLSPEEIGTSEAPEAVVGTDGTELRQGGGGDDRFSLFHYNKLAFMITGAALAIVLLIGIGSMLLLNRHPAGSTAGKGSGYAVGSELQLGDVRGSKQLQVGEASQLTVNGLLQVSDTLVLAPTDRPASPVKGQIYYDRTANTLYYYDGTQFVSLNQSHVTSIGGVEGVVGLGAGLTMVGNQLSVSNAVLRQGAGSGVNSLQGQTGDVTLAAGPGIGISGTTISNQGVISLVAGSANLTVTSDGSGHYTVSAASGVSGITGSGTAGHIPKFSGTTDITDSNLIESGSTLTYAGNLVVNAASGFVGNLINLAVNGSSKLTVTQDGSSVQAGTLTVNGTGASSVAGSLSVGTGLAVTAGGISVTGNSTIAGTLGSLTGLTSSGTITLSSLNSSGVVHTNGSGVLSTGPVALGVDTSGSYVSQLGSLTGLITTGNSGAGSTPTLSVDYGAGANKAVQGNTVLNCPSGTGNLSGGGNAITLGSGGSCNGISITNSPVFSGTLGVQGAGGITAGVAGSTTGLLNLANSGNSNLGTLRIAALGQATTYVLPDPGQASADICLSTGNCAGSGGGVIGSGTSGRIAKFTGSNSIADSTLSESGSTLTASGNVVIQGANSLSLGTASGNTGALTFYNGANGNTFTLQAGATGGNLTFTLPTADGSNGNCLKTNGSGTLTFASCTGGAGGGVTSVDGLTGVLTLNNSSGSGATITIDDASTSQKGIAQFNATNFTASSGTINTIQNIATTSSPTFSGLTLSNALTVANGGTGANTLTLNGILYGNGTSAIQATAAAANSVLATDGSNVPGLTQTLPAAVQGNITTVGALAAGSVTSGFGNISTGNLISTTSSLHGGTLTVGSSSQFQVDASGNFTTTGTGAIQGAGGLTLGNPGSTTGSLNLANATSSRQVILQGLNPSGTGNATVQLPSIAGGSTDTVCLLTLANCVGAGGSIAGTGTATHIAKFTAANTIADSGLTESGSVLTYAGNLIVNAANGFSGNLINLEVNSSSKLSVDQAGSSIQAGTLTVNGTGASSIAGTLSVGTLGSGGTTALCSNAGVIGTCASTGSIGYWNRTGTTLQPANSGDNISTSGNISTTGSGTLTVAGTSSLMGNVGIGTASPNTSLSVYNGNESLTQTDFTQGLSKGGINIVTDFTDGAYTPGVFWSTQDNNATKPKAGIYMFEDGTFGTSLLFGTSSSYATGITNTALRLGPSGEALFKNGSNSSTGFQIQNTAGAGLFTVNTSTGATITSTLFIDTLGSGGSTALCWNGSSQVSTCSGTGSPFIQGGNTFGTAGILGTNDNFGLNFETNNTTVASLSNTGAALFKNSANSTTAFQIQNASAQSVLVADTTNQRIAVGPAAVPANGVLTVGTNTTVASGGIYFGTDTNLYRKNPGELATDSYFHAFSGMEVRGGAITYVGGSSTETSLQLRVSGDTQYRYTVDSSGKMTWGPGGTTAGDVQLARGGTGSLVLKPTTGNDSTSAFQIQNAAGNFTVLNADTTNGTVGIGGATTVATLKVTSSASGQVGLMVNKTTGTDNILELQNSGTAVTTVSSTGAALFKNSANSTTAFQIQNAAGTSLFTADTSNNRIGIGAAPLAGYELYVQSNSDTTLRAKNIGSANVFELANNTGNVLTVTNSGATTLQTTTNSIAAFQIQNAAGTSIFNADTTNKRIGINVSSPSYALDVANSSNDIVANFTGHAGGASDTAEAAFNNRAAVGYDGTTQNAFLQGTSGKGLLLQVNGTTNALALSSTGAATFKNGTNSSTAFQIQNAAGTNLVTADTSNLRVNVVGDANIGTRFGSRLFSDNFESDGFLLWDQGTTGAVDTNTTFVHDGKYSAQINPAGASAYVTSTITNNTTVYARAWVYVASQTSSNADLLTLENAGASAATSFTVFRNSGNLWLWNNASPGGTNSGAALSTGAWHVIEMRITTGNPTGVSQVWLDGTQVINLSGQNNSANDLDTLRLGDNAGSRTFTAYFDDVAADTVSTGTASSLNVDDSLHVGGSATFGNNLLVNVGDNYRASLQLAETNDRGFNLFYDTGANEFVLQANDAGSLNNAMTINRTTSEVTFQPSTDTTTAFQIQNAGGATMVSVDTTAANGHLEIGGSSGGGDKLELIRADTTTENAVRFTTSTGTDWKIYQPTGSSALQFWNDNNADILTLGTNGSALFKNQSNSTTAFQIQNTSSAPLFVADTSNSRLYVGNPSADSTGVLLVLDTKNTAGDPTAVAGGMYFNSSTGSFRCSIDGSTWQACGPQTKELAADQSSTSNTLGNVTNMTFSISANTDYSIMCNVIYTSASTTNGIKLAFNGPASPNAVVGDWESYDSTTTSFQGALFRAYDTNPATSNVDTANALVPSYIRATIRNGANAGTLALRFASENAGTSVSIKTGTNCSLTQL